MNAHPKAWCAFCGKGQDDVSLLIAGPTVFICNECVALCQAIVADRGAPLFTQHQEARIRELADEQIIERSPSIARAIAQRFSRSARGQTL